MKSNERKLRGGSKSVLTKLKALCLKQPAVVERIMEYMNKALSSGATPTSAQIRQFIGEHFNVQLQWDSQFSSFLSWVNLSRKTAEREQAIEEWLRDESKLHPELTDEELNQRGQRKFKLLSIAEEQPSDWARILREEIRLKRLTQLDKQIALERDKFEFDASRAALKIWPSIRQISSDKTLSETDKVQAVRQRLFGVIPQ
jgi:hypothetical protein